MKADKPVYAPLPARAMAADKLSALDLRVLMAIAAHDRLGANGIGCWASHTRLAQLVGCHLKSLSRSIADLVQGGWITAKQHPVNGRLRVYQVRYTEMDAAMLKQVSKGNETATYPEPIGNQTAPEIASIGNQSKKIAERIQEDAECNIFSETGIYPVETGGRYPVETASRKPANGKSLGALLGMCQREIAANRNLKKHVEYLEDLVGDGAQLDPGSELYGWAERLLIEAGDKLDAAA